MGDQSCFLHSFTSSAIPPSLSGSYSTAISDSDEVYVCLLVLVIVTYSFARLPLSLTQNREGDWGLGNTGAENLSQWRSHPETTEGGGEDCWGHYQGRLEVCNHLIFCLSYLLWDWICSIIICCMLLVFLDCIRMAMMLVWKRWIYTKTCKILYQRV